MSVTPVGMRGGKCRSVSVRISWDRCPTGLSPQPSAAFGVIFQLFSKFSNFSVVLLRWWLYQLLYWGSRAVVSRRWQPLGRVFHAVSVHHVPQFVLAITGYYTHFFACCPCLIRTASKPLNAHLTPFLLWLTGFLLFVTIRASWWIR